MSDKTKQTAPAADNQPEITQDMLDRAVAQAREEGMKLGAVQERERIQAILCHEEAKCRQGLARKIAFTMDIDPEQAVALLEAAAKEEPEPPQPKSGMTEFEKHMAAIGNPDVGPDRPDDGESAEALARMILQFADRGK